MMKKAILLTFAILFSLVSLDYALETDTHELINEYIVINALNGFSLDLYLKEQLNIDQGIEEIFGKNEVSEWLKKGGKYEDKPNWHTLWGRSVNHFHNPLSDEGFSGIWGISWLSGVSSIEWSQKPVVTQSPGGYYSWYDVRDYFYNALTAPTKSERDENFAQTFRGLGQLMHLVQDLSVPAHTRGDGHIGYIRYNYEMWARDSIKDISTYTPEYFNSFEIDTPNSLAAVPVANLFDTNQYDGSNPDITLQNDIGLSEYTNANFFSNDTIFHNFPYPAKDSVLLDDIAIPDPRYPYGDVLRKYFNKMSDGDTGYRLATVSFLEGSEEECAPNCSDWFYEHAALDSEVYGDYATRLIPPAMRYSAGLLAYFFRGKLEVTLGDGDMQITNKSGATMHDGTFEVYYDNEQGQRQTIAISAGAEIASLPPDQDTTLTFDPPADFGENALYIIVYRGALGNETNTVIGKVLPTCKYLNWRFVPEPNCIDYYALEYNEGINLSELFFDADAVYISRVIDYYGNAYTRLFYMLNHTSIKLEMLVSDSQLTGYQSVAIAGDTINAIEFSSNFGVWITRGVHSLLSQQGWEIFETNYSELDGEIKYSYSDGVVLSTGSLGFPMTGCIPYPDRHYLDAPATFASVDIEVDLDTAVCYGLAGQYVSGQDEPVATATTWTISVDQIEAFACLFIARAYDDLGFSYQLTVAPDYDF